MTKFYTSLLEVVENSSPELEGLILYWYLDQFYSNKFVIIFYIYIYNKTCLSFTQVYWKLLRIFPRAQRVNIVLSDQFYSINKVVTIFYIKHAQVLHKFIGKC